MPEWKFTDPRFPGVCVRNVGTSTFQVLHEDTGQSLRVFQHREDHEKDEVSYEFAGAIAQRYFDNIARREDDDR